MSQPDQYLPESAWNFVSLAEIAAKSQEDWETETKQPYLDQATAILDSLFGGLPVIEGASFVLRLLTALVRKLTGNAELVYDTAEGALDALKTLVGDVISGVVTAEQDLLNAIANALGHTGDEPYSPTDILGFLGEIPGDLISGATTVEQDIIDKACNALGVAGTGHTTSDLLTALGNIPASVVSGVTDTEQDLLNAIANALGHTGDEPYSVSDILGFLGTDVTTAISTAASDASTALTNASIAITNAASALSAASGAAADIAAMLAAVSMATADDFGDFLAAASGNVHDTMDSIWNGIFGGSDTGKDPTDVQDAVSAFLTGIYNMITGGSTEASTPLTGGTASIDLTSALDSQNHNISLLSDAVTQLQRQLSQLDSSTLVDTGNSTMFDFRDYADGSLPTGLTAHADSTQSSSGTGHVGIVSGRAAWVQAGASYNCQTVLSDTATDTDRQIVSAVFTGTVRSYSQGLVVRANSTGSRFVRFRFLDGGNGDIEYVIDGVRSVISTYVFYPTVGATYSLVAGTDAGDRWFQLLKNGVLQDEWEDAGAASYLGASYRYGGFSIQGANTPAGQPGCMSVARLTVADSPVPFTLPDWLSTGRITPRAGTAAGPGGTPTLNTDLYDIYTYTALAAAITSMTTNLSGTPTIGQRLLLGFKDNGSPRTIAWGTSYVASGNAPLLATTVTSKQHWCALMWDGAHWVAMATDVTGY